MPIATRVLHNKCLTFNILVKHVSFASTVLIVCHHNTPDFLPFLGNKEKKTSHFILSASQRGVIIIPHFSEGHFWVCTTKSIDAFSNEFDRKLARLKIINIENLAFHIFNGLNGFFKSTNTYAILKRKT